MPLKSNATLYTSQNVPLTLDKKIGEGGEGYVCTVKGINGNHFDNHVAKIYHISHLPNYDKQDKLRYMVANSDKDLLSYIAWATDTLHKRKGGRIIGFLMPKIADCSPIHTLYNPSHRRQTYPNATWKFLLYTARNVASAIDTLHSKGHVIGDINQGNLLFSKDSKVTLIDADSFQITTPTTTHLSLVGVAHFTPPELQGNSNFDSIARTQNHDNFGLAVLIFHLLFGGRHPFAGVPLIDEAGHLLEHDIKAYRYAYTADHKIRGIKPPPASIPIEIVPKEVQDLFIQAFTEVGSINGSRQRPTAETWMNVLDGLRSKVITCKKHKQHEYLERLSTCPWCQLESMGVFYFGKPVPFKSKKGKIVAKDKINIKQEIERLKRISGHLPSYDAYSLLPQPSHFTVTATPFSQPKKQRKPIINPKITNYIMYPPINTDNILGKILSALYGFIFLCISVVVFLAGFFGILFGAIIGMSLLMVYWTRVPTRYTYWMGGWYILLGVLICYSPIWYFLISRILKAFSRTPEFKKRKTTLNTARGNYFNVEQDLKILKLLIKDYQTEKSYLYLAYDKYREIKKNPYKYRIQLRRGKVIAKDRAKVLALQADILATMEKHYKEAQKLQQQIETEQKEHKQNAQHYQQLAKELAQAEADYELLTDVTHPAVSTQPKPTE